jgi:tRNA(Leu) C34 or U34 (ribose-2'-O)-methylase TrmL
VIFPTHRQAPLTPAAVKASAGAVEHLLLVPVDDLAAALADLHSRGLRVAGAEADAPLTVRQADLRGPLVLVVGSEGQGLGPTVRRRCDVVVRIPMRGSVGSLNAAVAGSILLFEALAQRDDAPAEPTQAGTPAEPVERTPSPEPTAATGSDAAPPPRKPRAVRTRTVKTPAAQADPSAPSLEDDEGALLPGGVASENEGSPGAS